MSELVQISEKSSSWDPVLGHMIVCAGCGATMARYLDYILTIGWPTFEMVSGRKVVYCDDCWKVMEFAKKSHALEQKLVPLAEGDYKMQFSLEDMPVLTTKHSYSFKLDDLPP